ncbi:hypothetical protein H0H93_013528, partial [Arthromyces matolae]
MFAYPSSFKLQRSTFTRLPLAIPVSTNADDWIVVNVTAQLENENEATIELAASFLGFVAERINAESQSEAARTSLLLNVLKFFTSSYLTVSDLHTFASKFDTEPTDFPETATHVVDFGPGGLSGIGPLTARNHVSFKPGSVDGIRQVINIAAANPNFPIIMQWTGGRAGGHHSFEDFHQPILSTYRAIRRHPNISLVAGSGFGSADDVWPYLTGDWSVERFGVQPMPPSVKDLIVAASGVELGEPIHKVATRGVKLWKEFDDTVFKLPKEKRAAWLKERHDEVIGKLNKDFAKPWFGWKRDGSVASDLGDMTYEEVVLRM